MKEKKSVNRRSTKRTLVKRKSIKRSKSYAGMRGGGETSITLNGNMFNMCLGASYSQEQNVFITEAKNVMIKIEHLKRDYIIVMAEYKLISNEGLIKQIDEWKENVELITVKAAIESEEMASSETLRHIAEIADSWETSTKEETTSTIKQNLQTVSEGTANIFSKIWKRIQQLKKSDKNIVHSVHTKVRNAIDKVKKDTMKFYKFYYSKTSKAKLAEASAQTMKYITEQSAITEEEFDKAKDSADKVSIGNEKEEMVQEALSLEEINIDSILRKSLLLA
jgi:hypothetical protein